MCRELGQGACLPKGGFKATSKSNSVPMSTSAMENRSLVLATNSGWISLFGVPAASLFSLLFDEVTLANHRFLLVPKLGGYHAGCACGMIAE